MEHRTLGYSLLMGAGIEIGALHNPARVPARCKVAYCDAMTANDAKKSFPELAELPLVAVDHVVDLDQSGLSNFTQGSQDFVILNHVIEHVANPIHVIAECFRVLRPGGLLVLSAPDMRFTFDKTRALTTSAHLWDEFEQGVTQVSDAHYEDFLNAVHPEVNSDPQRFAGALVAVRDRREHAHVWNSHTFGLFVRDILDRHSIPAQILFESVGEDNHNEYFSVWRKRNNELPEVAVDELASRLRFAMQQSSMRVLEVTNACRVVEQQCAGAHQELATLRADKLEWIGQLENARQARTAAQRMAQETQVLLDNERLCVADKERHIKNVESMLDTSGSQLAEHRQKLDAVLGSRSWKITGPVRRLAAILKRGGA